ncbi:MAG: spore cortex biosynthesis protein YabQ [Oscillospiraceae bacterium]|nr:spore cortex biosynthesis protein YabQ [Oscillospiraceae bacterium]
MENPISRQLLQALAAFCLGLVGAIFYDALRVLRRRVNSRALTAVCDILFSLCFCCGLFLLGFSVGMGRQRVFMWLFAALSAALYFNTAGPLVRNLIAGFYDIVFKIVHLALTPVDIILFFAKKIIYFMKNIFHYAVKWYTIYSVSIFPTDGGDSAVSHGAKNRRK